MAGGAAFVCLSSSHKAICDDRDPCPPLPLCAYLNAHNECLNRHLLVWVSTPAAAFLSKPLQPLFSLGFCVYSASPLSLCHVIIFHSSLSWPANCGGKLRSFDMEDINCKWEHGGRGSFVCCRCQICHNVYLQACIYIWLRTYVLCNVAGDDVVLC